MPFFQGQPAAGTQLGLVSDGKLNEKARRYQHALHGFKYDGCVEIGPNIHTGRLRRFICGKRMFGTVYDFYGCLHKKIESKHNIGENNEKRRD